ncbi:3-ketoacyl-ACP reductase [Brenneria goodwinii]|uniref:3-ketoacyl-ACP reductase n=1 Tax=Brenneria goodwinii TaxID=1109412 RepID=UPI0036F092DC
MTTTTRPVALITGSTRGIGRQCAIELAKQGFNVAINGRDTPDGLLRQQALVDLLGEYGAEAIACSGNVAQLEQHQPMLERILERWGRLDCLVNNAGTAAKQRGDLLDVSAENYQCCLDINAQAMFFLSQRAARIMLQQGELNGYHRSIINITSCSASILSINRAEYCVSKAAASMVTQLFALRLAEEGIGVYEVRPGIINTDMTRVVKPKYDRQIADGLVPMKRWGETQDVAQVVQTLAAGRLPFTVGQIINVDGGLNVPHF